ncbi:carboxymuconolactone decarboxylase family protein [Salinadaptatus halalkaliphilus]|uniref:Carboxymuconolactone decarboxylase family protein n=1 Tax=Salinadaptatus halalkaliphilus TaxID=2419781 RepID=A0A4S3TML5_9EURY|nr:carboxymuconolactone decarboxylase family protein [Salinadaptatus halalkaliphilus]THE65504.1 carboxymuconolactone decarboxylase family protein [Salinadaptatus halalkaliphilus]
MARIRYADPSELPPEKRDLLDTLSDADPEARDHSLEGGTLNVYRTLGRNVDVLEGFREYGGVVWEAGGLSAHERETVILSTAYYAETAYEWHQHVRVALDEGMDPEAILAISREETDRLPADRATLVAYVERFVEGDVDDDLHEQVAAHYDEETILGVNALAGCYLGLARLLQALDVDLEQEFVGWDLENL